MTELKGSVYDRNHMSQPPKFSDLLEPLFKGPVRHRDLEVGQHLFAAGDPVESLYFVDSGRVRLVRYGPEGSILCLQTARQGQTLAEASLFEDVYHCDAVAERPSRVKVAPKREILRSLMSDCAVSIRAMAHLTRQIESLHARLEIVAMKSARARLLTYLDWIREPGEDSLVIKDSWKEIATEIGLSHEVVYRTLAVLEDEGLISRKDRTVELLNS